MPKLLLLQFNGIKIQSFCIFKAQKIKMTKINMHLYTTATEMTRTEYSTKKSSNQSIVLCVLLDDAMNYFVSLVIFMHQGCRMQR